MQHIHRESPNTIHCPEHGIVTFHGTGDFVGDSPDQAVTLYCPECLKEEQTQHAQHPNTPFIITECKK